jgi:nucleotide-binding universal stress UspA family protein
MKQVQKILFPVDLSENFEILTPWVSTLVHKFDATLYVLFVTQDLKSFTSFYVPHANLGTLQEEAIKAAEQKMAAAVQESFRDLKKVETRVLTGSPAEKILEFAKQEGVDLIIMGTHGRKFLEQAIFGSVMRKVAQGASCPVLAIPPEGA